jgi:hypothetical protein
MGFSVATFAFRRLRRNRGPEPALLAGSGRCSVLFAIASFQPVRLTFLQLHLICFYRSKITYCKRYIVAPPAHSP